MPEMSYSPYKGEGNYYLCYDGIPVGIVRQNKKDGTFSFTSSEGVRANNLENRKKITHLTDIEKEVKKTICKKWLKSKQSEFHSTHTHKEKKTRHIMLVNGIAVGVATTVANNGGYIFQPIPDLRLKSCKAETLYQLQVKISLDLKKGTRPTNWEAPRITKAVNQQKK